MKLGDCGSMSEYIKKMIEIFDELAVVAEAVAEEDKVICLLAGLPDSSVVTARCDNTGECISYRTNYGNRD